MHEVMRKECYEVKADMPLMHRTESGRPSHPFLIKIQMNQKLEEKIL